MRLLLLALLLSLPGVASAAPLQLAHHGQLLDAFGTPVTGTQNVTFRLWDADTGGNAVWSEVVSVDAVGGHYSALLNLGTSGRDLLRDEPSLWLELEIGGSPLLPRQSVASTPYAVIADTAENLEGGTVNAQSISVNNTTVIDASGMWTGGTGSIAWEALGDVPLALEDGDADTLGGLSCADGDRAAWNQGLGQWGCGSAPDWATLNGVPAALLDGDADSLASLACSLGERIEWTGTEWQCVPMASAANMYLRESGGLVGSAMVGAAVLCDDLNDIALAGGCKTNENGTTHITATGPAAEDTASTWSGGNTANAVITLPGASERGGWGCALRHESNGTAIGSAYVVCLAVP